MQLALTGHVFERRILDYCRGKNMDRVVTALDYGTEDIIHHGARDPVFFLVFERAEGALRRHIRKNEALNLLWAVTTLHNLFIAVSQLHSATVAHNDIKPANALVFSRNLQKLADLGRAPSSRFPAMHDDQLCAGDRRYAPPEQLYPNDSNCGHLAREDLRVVGDLYNLGSLTYFVLTARSLTMEIVPTLRLEHRPFNKAGGSRDSFQAALPYSQEAFAEILARTTELAVTTFGPGVDSEIRKLVEIVRDLGQPNPLERGHPKDRTITSNRYNLQRYITMLDAIKKRLFIRAA
jgi:serine/threonine protein kinase